MKQKNLVLITGLALVLVMTFSVVSAGWFTGKAVDWSNKIYRGNTRAIPGTDSKITIESINFEERSAVILINDVGVNDLKEGETANFEEYSVYLREVGKTLYTKWVKVDVKEIGESNDEEETCVDGDGGKNYYVKGTVSASDESGADECCTSLGEGGNSCPGNGDILKEWYCDSTTLGEDEFYKCPFGCSNGACIGESSSSGKITYIDPTSCEYKKVTEEGNPGSVSASCSNANQVVLREDVYCPKGYEQSALDGYTREPLSDVSKTYPVSLPYVVSYTCISSIDGKTLVKPSHVIIFCCDIKSITIK
jgi:hypothetical protein